MKFPCYVHGMLKTESFSGAIRPEGRQRQVHDHACPQERRPKQSRLEVRYSPTLAGAMVDALPYLVDYPYGCTEQTLNRFLPTVITQKILLDMRLDLKDIQQEADQPERPGDRRRRASGPSSGSASTATRSSTRTRSARWSRTACERLTEMQLLRRRLGLVLRLGRALLRRTPRPWSSTACRSPSRTTWPWCPACWSAASRGSSATRTSRSSCSRTPPKTSRKDALEGARRQPRRLRLHGAGRRRREERRDARLPLPRPHATWPSTPRPCSAWPWTSRASRRSWP